MKTLRVGVLGCADIAIRRVLPAFAAVPGVEVVAVASRDSTKAALTAARFNCEAIAGYENLLARHDIDAVYIPVPAALHGSWTLAALEAGLHVLCEKPLTTSLEETTKLVTLADEKGLVLMENFMFLHHHQNETVRQLVAEGAIGELRSFTSAFTIPSLSKDDIRYQPELGGGSLLDVGVYPLRAAQLFLGAELEVRGASLRYVAGVDVAGEALLRNLDGLTAQITFGMEHVYRSSYELWGSEGHIRVGRAFSPPIDHHPRVLIERPDGQKELVLEPDDQYANAVEHFVLAVGSHAHGDGGEQTIALAHLVDRVQRCSSG
ncbi:MAG TPA: oxidoreductase [Micromonosporaceae bacterium]|nr:oxidoreductase [Micromonosporaceae bacterium]HCU48534.1 oxidoreductase [Micromonosporaceae bacterium]